MPIKPVTSKSELDHTVDVGSHQLALPIPLHERNANGKVKQNKGY